MIKTISKFKMTLLLLVMATLCGTTEVLAQDVTYITPNQLSPSTVFKIQNDGIYVLAAKAGEEADPTAAPTTFDGYIQISSGKNVTLYLNGHTLTCSKSHKIIENLGNLTLYGTYPGGNEGGIIDGYYANNTAIRNCGISQVNANTSILIDGVIIQNCNYSTSGGAISNSNGTLEIRNSVITDCGCTGNGGAVYFNSTNGLLIDNTTIQRCSSTTSGGAIYKIGGKGDFTISNSLIEDCSSKTTAGAIHFGNNAATLEVSNTTIRNCESKGNGGGIYSVGIGTVIFKDNSTIDNCAAPNYLGGGIYIGGSGKLTMEDGLIEQCFADTGGGVFVSTSGTFTMNGGTIEYCYAVQDRDKDFVKDGDPAGEGYVGGGVCVQSSTMNFNGGTIQYCHAGTGSGGIHTWYGDARAYLYINGSTCKVTHCDAYSYGGCTHVGNGSHCIMYDGEVSYNTCYHGSDNENGGAFEVGFAAGSRFEIYGGKICYNRALAEGPGSPVGLGGGIFMRKTGGSGGSIVIAGGEITDNYAANKGGGIYARISVTVDGASILRNEAVVDGGGIYFENTCSYFRFISGEISDNTAGNNGGALYFDKFGTNSIELIQGMLANNTAGNYGGGVYMVDSKITFGQGTNLVSFENNSAIQGGGLYISSTGSGKRDVTINNSSFIENTASDCGGGIYLSDNGKGTLYLKEAGTYSQNTAANDGGAIFVDNILAVAMTNGSFTGNEATEGRGGGMYIGTGTITLSSGSASENIAYDGGAFYANGGLLAINGSYRIYNNVAKHDGAGFYANGGAVEIKGGTINENKALSGNGGGIYACESSTVKMSDGNIADNQAKNGGGIYLAAGADMTMSNGLIRYNKAVSAMGATIPTAYHAGADLSIQGIGGGIYLSSGTNSNYTTLTFDLPKTVGIYGNTATLGADEILADGLYTQITVPNVEGMDLEEYSAKVDGWYEDYITNDTHYGDGTKMAPAGTPVRRYEDYIAQKESPYLVPYTTASEKDKYICLRLGYTPLANRLIIIKSGMKSGETAIFKISKTAAESQILYTVPVTAGADGRGNITLKDMEVDEYTVQEETDWSWAYTSDPASGKITQNIGEKNTFTFKNTPKKDTPPHAEANVNNKLEKKTTN